MRIKINGIEHPYSYYAKLPDGQELLEDEAPIGEPSPEQLVAIVRGERSLTITMNTGEICQVPIGQIEKFVSENMDKLD